jgi:hypothetical protein
MNNIQVHHSVIHGLPLPVVGPLHRFVWHDAGGDKMAKFSTSRGDAAARPDRAIR